MPRYLITGCNGLLGQGLIATLRRTEPQTTLHGIGTRPAPCAKALSYTQLDLRDDAQVDDCIKHFCPTHIIHTAAYTQVDGCEQNQLDAYAHNVQAVEHLVRSMQTHTPTAHIVHLSTDFIFDGSNPPYAEEAPPSPCNYYGKTKQLAEEVLRQSTRSHSILRTSLVYGNEAHTTRKNIFQWVVEALQQQQTLHMQHNQWRMPTYNIDLAHATIAALHHSGTFNVVGADLLTPYTFATTIADVFGLSPQCLVPTHAIQPNVAPRPIHTALITTKAQTILHYRPTPIRTALQLLRQNITPPHNTPAHTPPHHTP